MNAAIEQHKEPLELLIGRGLHIPALPTQCAELLKLTRQSPDTIDMKKVVTLVENEPTMTAMLLRLANSSRYGTSRTIRRVDHALFIVGLDEALSMLEFYLLRNMFPRWLNLPHFTVDGYWFHSWVCARTAQILGQPRFLVQSLPGELYIAGLLHDIGKAVMAVHFSVDCTRAYNMALQEGISTHEAERAVFGVDHAVLGAALLNKWMLPPVILDAVGCHHDPEQAAPEHRELAALVQLADAIAACVQDELGNDDLRRKVTNTVLFAEGRSPLVREDVIWSLIEDIRERLMKDSHETFNLDDNGRVQAMDAGELPPRFSTAPPAAQVQRISSTGPLARFFQWLGALFRS